MIYQARVTDVGQNGIYVELAINGTRGRYGPMHYVSSDGVHVVYVPGDNVLIASVGKISDQYIILGKVIDPNVLPYYQPQDPYGDGGPTP